MVAYWSSREKARAKGARAEVALVGHEAELQRKVRARSSAGATDFLAVIFPVGDDAAASVARTRSFVQRLIGKV